MRNKRELLVSVTKKDLEIEWFHGSGAGGQHRNKHANCCRIRHRDSGVTTQCTENRSREANQRIAFKRLTEHPKFKLWLNAKSHEVMEGKSIEKKVEEMMRPENIKTEVKVDGRWVDEVELDERESTGI